MSKNKVSVTIAGKEYNILSGEPEEYLQKIAKHLDSKITEIAYANNKITVNMATVLAAVNVTDEYFKSLETSDNLRRQIGCYIDDASKERSELTSLRAENERLKKELQKYRDGGDPKRGQQSML